MDRLIYELKGFDVQCLSELQDIFSEHNSGSVVLVKGKAWRFRLDVVSLNGIGYYTQVTATDVDELYRHQLQLEESSRKLERAGRPVIREEEILSMKIRVHDDIGRSVIATRNLLSNNRPTSELDLTAWKNAVRLLMRDNEKSYGANSYDISGQLNETSSVLGIEINVEEIFPTRFIIKYSLRLSESVLRMRYVTQVRQN